MNTQTQEFYDMCITLSTILNIFATFVKAKKKIDKPWQSQVILKNRFETEQFFMVNIFML